MGQFRPLLALFLRSLQDDPRSRLPIMLRAGMVALVLLFLWGNQRMFSEYSGAPGRDFFMMVAMINCCFVGVAALSIFSSAITEEKEDQTLPLLRMTNLSVLAILFGKSTSRFCSAMLLLAVQIPFTLLSITLGGVRMEQIVAGYAVIAGTTFFLCNLSLFCSVYCRTTVRAAMLVGVVGVILYIVLTYFAFFIAFRGFNGRAMLMSPSDWVEQFWAVIVAANPLYAIAQVLSTGGGGSILKWHLWFTIGSGLLFFLLSWMLFDRLCSDTGETVHRMSRKRKNGRPRRWTHVTRPWTRFPLAWKDFFFSSGGRIGFYVRFALVAALFVTAAALVFRPLEQNRSFYSYRGWREVGEIGAIFAMIGAGIELLLIAGRIFGTERRLQTLSSLVTLPWSVGKIIRQKLFGALPVLLPWMMLGGLSLYFAFEGVWEDVALGLREFFEHFNWERYGDDLMIPIYVSLQAVVAPMLIAWLSLRMKRGALPTGIVILVIWNVLFAIMVDETNLWAMGVSRRFAEVMALFVGCAISLIAIVLVGFRIYRGVPRAAADEG
jgi:hypothetical protein